MPPRSVVPVVAVALAVAVALSGCVPEPPAASPSSPAPTSAAPTGSVPTGTITPPATPTPTSSPTTTPGATPTPTPTPTRSPSPGTPSRAVLPGCDDLLPLSTVHALFGDAAEPLDAGGSAEDYMPGPAAARAAASARQSAVCTWAIPFSDGGFTVVTAELSASSRDALLSSLRGASSYRSTRIDGARAFTHESDSEFGTIAVVYVFDGSVWITVTGTLTVATAREFASSALDAVRAAN